jgi:hypothetical protein
MSLINCTSKHLYLYDEGTLLVERLRGPYGRETGVARAN